jgi:hypothetical protein
VNTGARGTTACKEAIYDDDNTKVAHMLTPELILMIAGAVAGLLGAVAYAWRAYSDVQKLRADTERMKAQAAAEDNANMGRLIEFTGQLTIAINAIASGLKAVEVASMQQTEILKELVSETQATRIDLKAWPELTATELRNMKDQIKELERSVDLLVASTDKHRESIAAVEAALTRLVEAVQQLIVAQHAPDAPAENIQELPAA